MPDNNTPVTNPELVAAIEALQKEANDDAWDAYRRAFGC